MKSKSKRQRVENLNMKSKSKYQWTEIPNRKVNQNNNGKWTFLNNF